MIESGQGCSTTSVLGLPPSRREKRESVTLTFLLLAPVFLFASSLFLVRPVSLTDTFSLTLAAPVFLMIAILLVRMPRVFFVRTLGLVAVEFTFLTIIVGFALLSLVNADSVIRSFRTIYPSLLPFAIVCHFTVLRYAKPNWLLWVPRIMIAGGVVFSALPILVAMVFPPLDSYLSGSYRVRGFFENSIQHSIALATLIPLIVMEFTQARVALKKVAWGLLLLLMLYTSFRAGSKAAMTFGMLGGVAMYVVLALRSRSFMKIGIMFCVMTFMTIVIWNWGLVIAETINPVIGEKFRNIVEGGLANYQSIESRKQLWGEAIEQGKRHWLVGTGAGEKVLGMSHAHNLVLDYFKGIGIFGAAAIVGLCLTILFRAGSKCFTVLRYRGDEVDVRILACYFSASVYVICNQLSDCFGPSTVGFLWITYLAGRLSETKSEPGTRWPYRVPVLSIPRGSLRTDSCPR